MSRTDPAQEGLERRVSGYPVPDGLFDPGRAMPEERLRYGVPPRPSARELPQLRPAWEQAFGQPLRLLPFSLGPGFLGGDRFRLLPRRLEAGLPALTRFEASSNWSGAYVSAHGGRRFTQVWGRWRVPDKLKPSPLPATPGKDYKVAAWIGLDGQRRYFDASLPQMGTTSILRPDGTEAAEAWVQWWARDELGLQLAVLPLTVSQGDPVVCVLTALGPQEVSCIIVNMGTTPFTGLAVTMIPPMVPVPGGGVARPDITGATAEWVVERPRDVDADRLENFPDYGQTRFDFCLAVLAEAPSLAGWIAGNVTGLEGARDIRMFDALEHPARTQFISMPKKLGNTTLRLRYGGFR